MTIGSYRPCPPIRSYSESIEYNFLPLYGMYTTFVKFRLWLVPVHIDSNIWCILRFNKAVLKAVDSY